MITTGYLFIISVVYSGIIPRRVKNMNTVKPRINYIRIRWEVDEDPDISYLESTISEDGKTMISSCNYTQKELDEHPIRTRRYIKRDLQRLEKFYSGELSSCGPNTMYPDSRIISSV